MLKLIVVGTIVLAASANEHHPINKKIVEEIKKKTNLWTPHEVETNPLRHKSKDELLSLLTMQTPVNESPFLPI
jgi:hypothetical protein